MTKSIRPRYVIVTKWGYPFGGGEQFMLGTMLWATQHDMDAYVVLPLATP